MVGVALLGSGSRGNCLIVDTGGTRVAVDAGFGPRTLAQRLRAAAISPHAIGVCVITHEHLDHSQGALRAQLKWRWPLAATAPTLTAIGAGHANPRTYPLAYGVPAAFGSVRVTLLKVSHDAVAPSAVLIEDCASGARVGVAYDLGEIPDGLEDAFARLDLLVLEANHDAGMLRAGPYSPALQARVAGKNGHLSNTQSAAFAARLAHKDLRAIVLAHLSEQNNTPEAARGAVARALRGTAFRGKLIAAHQDKVCFAGERKLEQLQLF